jgi:SAM-dependent methyltransferase
VQRVARREALGVHPSPLGLHALTRADADERGEPQHWFEPLADHLGAAYLRYSFTKGTRQEIDFLVDALGLQPGHHLLDVGCGPGRHAHELAARGIDVTGVDISARFVALARESTVADAPAVARFERADARTLQYDAEFDAALALCQGAFGLVGPGPDAEILAGMARAVRPGGAVAVSAFSAYFQVRFLGDADEFDAATATNHERTSIRDEAGREAPADLWTTCYTPRELRLLAAGAGLEVVDVWSVEPGGYERRAPGIDSPEFLLVARRPSRITGDSVAGSV